MNKLSTAMTNPKTANKAGSVTVERVVIYDRFNRISHIEVTTTVVKPDGTEIAKTFIER